MKMKRTLLTLLIIIATMWTNTANALGLTIDDTEIDLSTSKDLTGDWLEAGKVHWDAATKTLTLDNATLVSKVKPNDFIQIYSGEITIKLVGSNSISNENYTAIDLNFCKLTINGGSLKIKSKWRGISQFQQSTVTIDGCEVETNDMGNNSGPMDDHLVVKNATLKVKRVWDMTTITLIDCHIESPEGGKVIDKEMNGSMGQTIVDSDGEESVDIVIVPNSTDLREAYVVEDGSTLTFYYDANKKTRTGTVYGIYQKQASDKSIPAWAGTYNESKSSITSVVFDSSFKDYKPTSTSKWFYKCTNLKNIEGISNLNTENVTNMYCMFYGCSALTSLDLTNFNTANVTDMSKMFYGCSALTTLDLSNFNTANVTEMYCMFYGCSALTSLDLTNFNTANVTDMSYMFQYCENLTAIYCDDTWTCSESSGMFSGCTKLKGAVAYDENKTDASMANPTTGYFTKELHQTYDVVLESYNDQIIACIKVVRELIDVSIKEGKALVKSAPCIVVGNLSKEEAEAARDKFNAAGGTANVYPHGTWVPVGINPVGVDVPLKQQGIYNLQGMKLNTSLDRLPAGIYIVDGRKVVKK